MNNNNDDLNGIEDFAEADSLDEVVEQPGLAARRVPPPRHGGVEDNVPWTGGSPDPNLTRDYAMTTYRYREVEAPKGAYMSGNKLTQADLREVTCFKCGKTGHIAKYCDGKAKKSGNKKKQSAGNAGSSEKKKKQWQNENTDNETTKVVNGKTYKWCTNCNYTRGKWVDHDVSSCPHRRKDATTEENTNDSDEAGLMIMDLVESGFLAINIV